MRHRWYLVGAAVLAVSVVARLQLVSKEASDTAAQVRPVPPPPADPNLPQLVPARPRTSIQALPPAPPLDPETNAPRAQPKRSLAEVLVAARKAVGPETRRPLFFTGSSTVAGVRQPLTLTFEAGGRYRLDLSGTGHAAAGYDGTRNWTVGTSDRDDSGALVDGRIPPLATWVMTGGWLRAKTPCRAESLTEDPTAGTLTLLLSSPQSKQQARLVLDRRTHLPTTLILGHPIPTEIWRFEEYRTAHGVTLPYHLTRVRESGLALYAFSELSTAPTYTRSPFNLALEAPPTQNSDTAVAADQRPKGAPAANPVAPSREGEPGSPDATPPCEPQVAEQVRGERKGPGERDRPAPVARMSAGEAPSLAEPIGPAEASPIPAPKPALPDQEKPTLNGI